MQTNKLGSLTVSAVGLGCNNFGGRIDDARTDEVVGAALDAGITLFDTAEIYGGTRSEELLGRALGRRRDEVVIASKFGAASPEAGVAGGAAPDDVRRAVDGSLHRLGTDCIDLYQLHTPDDSTPIGDTLEALDGLVRAGKVREIGCSNFDAAQIEEAQKATTDRGVAAFVSVQNRYSVLHREPEQGVVQACRRHGMGILPYFPLEGGMLTGKYRPGEDAPEGSRLAGMGQRAERFRNARSAAIVEDLRAFCEQRSRSLLELAFSWLLAQPTVPSVIAGATSAEQIKGNVAAAGWQLTDAELAEVDTITGAEGQHV
ncbi:MAG: aldo/keto reductase [Actinomycetota bacterium]|jgi:aryl-alcohol dehydrogenase-like predicted oxidoreductase|nr:aldo/keto reductase [Actinomycetota bacterium]